MKKKVRIKSNNLLYIVLVCALIVFSVYLLITQNTNRIRQQEADAAGTQMKIATDPTFQEFDGVIVTGVPEDFPLYPGVELVGSAINNPAGMEDTGYRVKWHLPAGTSLIEVIDWYKKELSVRGWKHDNPDTWEGISELILWIERGNLKGYIAAEYEEGEVELVTDLNIIK